MEKKNLFEVTGTVRNATKERAYLIVEGLDYVLPVAIENADTYVGKTIDVVGTININVDHINLVATKVA